MKKEDKSLIDVENVYCFLRRIGLLFYNQSCFSHILCNLLQLPLWCVHCFILLALSVSTLLRRLGADQTSNRGHCTHSRCHHVHEFSIQDMTTFAIP